MKKVFPLKGRIQHYAWGGIRFIPELLGMNPDKNPSAEYWMGAHKRAPSIVTTEVGEMSLDTFVNFMLDILLSSMQNNVDIF